MKTPLLSLALALCFGMPAHAEDRLQQAIQSPLRSADYVKRDAARHPYQVLTFFGIRPDMTVVELVPGGGWYTEILAPYLKAEGRYIAAGFASDSASQYGRKSALAFQQKLQASPELYGKVQNGLFEPPTRYNFAAAGSVDMVLTFRNIHNWLAAGDSDLQKTFGSVFQALKPGGIFGVVEHRLPESRPQDSEANSGYVHQSFVIAMAEQAGFRLLASSEINANPKDLADYKNGVWSLPPTLSNGETDRARYLAIGESDRMTLKFVKP